MDSFWENKNVFVTGHTGFKGSWLCLCLDYLGAKMSGYALEPETTPSLYNQLKLDDIINSSIGDIRNFHLLEQALSKASPNLGRKSYRLDVFLKSEFLKFSS